MKLRQRLSGLADAAPVLLRDLAGLAGVASLSYGAWMAWPPAGFMVAGAMLLSAAYLSARGG